MNGNGMFRGIRGRDRVEILRLHRLVQFYVIFDLFLEGKATAAQVKERARKLLECNGLPRFR
jgi:hypothetical protein